MAKPDPRTAVDVNDAIDEEEDANGGGLAGGDKAPRLPRWTRQEILVLIQGKRVAEGRGRRGRAGVGLGPAQEPKWALVSAYCRRHGVNRGPVQCRKRWSNLSGDYKKIKEWETQVKEDTESFWVMRNDLRRERRLPGFFDREVYDILDGACAPLPEAASPAAVFDSGRSVAAEDGMFSDFEQEDAGGGSPAVTVVKEASPVGASLSDQKQCQPTPPSSQAQGTASEKQPALDPDIGSASHEGRKRKRFTSDVGEDAVNLENQLVDVLEKNGKMLAAQLEAQNTNFQLDREQRKDLTISLVHVLNKLADAIVKIADKL